MSAALLLSFAMVTQAAGESYDRMPVLYDGMTFTVKGRRLPNGNILWDSKDPENMAALEKAKMNRMLNFGVIAEKLLKKDDRDIYTAQTPEAKKFVADVMSQSDSDIKIHVTVIGSQEERDRVTRDIQKDPAFDSLRDRLYVQAYPPGHWAVNPALGFPTDGKPSIIVQTAKSSSDPRGGRVIYRTRDYSGGPKKLAEQIRRADPNYHPENDPGIASGFLGLPNSWLYGALVLVGLLVLLPAKEGV